MPWASGLLWSECLKNRAKSLSFPPVILLNVRHCCLIISLFEPFYMYLSKKEHLIKFLIPRISYVVEGNWLGIEFWAGLPLKLIVQALVHCFLPASVANEKTEV